MTLFWGLYFLMFIDTLPLIMQYSRLVGPIELLFVLTCAFAVLYISSPFPDEGPRIENNSGLGSYQYLYRAWQGELVLWFTFWPFFLIMNGALYGADYLAKSGIISVSSWGNIHMMLVVPVVWWSVAVWRSSVRTGSRWCSSWARLAVLSVYVEYGLRLHIRQQYPRIFFNCEELLLDYFSCF